MQPTAEQQAAVDAFRTGGSLVLEAAAGSGKTTTLKLLAKATPHRRGVYVAYNRAIATDAKRSFPPNVECATAHSLAYRAVAGPYKHRLNAGRQPTWKTAELLRINSSARIGGRAIPPPRVARLVMETVGRFCNSADRELAVRHVPGVNGLEESDLAREVADLVLPLAERAWLDLRNPGGSLRFDHDVYLKLWSLTDPHLPFDFVLLDEAQDANPVIAYIVQSQDHAQQVMVGDACQAIYGWRGAQDAMSTFVADRRLALTRSFRFGPRIAGEANKWLELLDARLRVEGHPPIESVVGVGLGDTDAVLCRTNAGAIARVMEAHAQGRKVALVGGGEQAKALAEASIELKAGRGCSHPELFAFQTWGEVQQYVGEDHGGRDLAVFVKLIDEHGPEAVIRATSRLIEEKDADLVVSTAHKAKGREWSSVAIGNDFQDPDHSDRAMTREEQMLAYVSVTRAMHVLDVGGLSFVNRLLTQHRLENPDGGAWAREQAEPAAATLDPLVAAAPDPDAFVTGAAGTTLFG
jgi:superfamily I DNA/RNA helicase